MSVKNALLFVQTLRNGESLRHRILACNPSPSLESLVILGAETMDLIFTVEDLKVAHRHDWVMRWMLCNSKLTSNDQ